MHGEQERSARPRRGGRAEELAHIPAKWAPVRRQEYAPNNESRARSDSVGTERALGAPRVQVIDITTPPSARTGEPVSALASRETTKATTSATSSGVVMRRRIELGRSVVTNSRSVSGVSGCPAAANIFSTPSVRVGPGSTALTVTPLPASAWAKPRVRARSADLVKP